MTPRRITEIACARNLALWGNGLTKKAGFAMPLSEQNGIHARWERLKMFREADVGFTRSDRSMVFHAHHPDLGGTWKSAGWRFVGEDWLSPQVYASRGSALRAARTWERKNSREPRCVNAHDRCYGGAGGPCPYCE